MECCWKGEANCHGFYVDYSGIIRIESEGWSLGEKYRFRTVLFTFILSSSLILLGSAILLGLTPLPLELLLTIHITCMICIIYVSVSVRRKIYQLQQWHGAEHKILYLVEREKELTVEKFKNTPLHSLSCTSGNKNLEEPDEEKTQEALRVGQQFLNKLNERWSLVKNRV